MDLTHWHLNAIARKRNLQQPPECCREAATEAIKAAYRAGREDAAKDIRAIKIGRDLGNVLRDAFETAAQFAEGKHAGKDGTVRMVTRGSDR